MNFWNIPTKLCKIVLSQKLNSCRSLIKSKATIGKAYLRTASFYLFLVKNGDWHVDVPGSGRTIDYLTDTYKYIAIFSLIESLQEKEIIDFYSFLVRRKSNISFLIINKQELHQCDRKYKQEYGSIQQSVQFFRSLTSQNKADPVKNLEVKNMSLTIENFSKYLYHVRSKFIHEAQLVVDMAGRITLSRYGNRVVICWNFSNMA